MKTMMFGSLIFLALAASSEAHAASTPGFSVVGSPGMLGNPPFTLGFEFSATSGYQVSGLGVFDADSDGLLDSHDVGLFNSAGTLLASATVDSGTSGSLVDGFRYVSIAPTLLTAGQDYYVGAVYTSGNDLLFFPGQGTVTSASGLSYITGTFASGDTLQAPLAVGGDGAYFGPNIEGTLSAVPLPASAPMFGAALMALGAVGYGMKRKAKAAA